MRPSRLLKLFEPSVLSQPWSMISGPDPSNYGDYGGAFNLTNKYWLVVLTILKNMKVSWEGLSHILWKINNDWNHQPEEIYWVATVNNHTSQLNIIMFIIDCKTFLPLTEKFWPVSIWTCLRIIRMSENTPDSTFLKMVIIPYDHHPYLNSRLGRQ